MKMLPEAVQGSNDKMGFSILIAQDVTLVLSINELSEI